MSSASTGLGSLGSLLRAAAQGRGLLRERGADGGAVRRRRPRGQAHLEAGRLGATLAGVRVGGADGGARTVARRSNSSPARRARRGRGHALADAGSLRTRRGDRAHARALRGHGGGDLRARRALGRQRPSARAARRGDPARRAHRVPRADRGDLLGGRRRSRPPTRWPTRRRGEWFDPALVDALGAVRDDASFWASLRDRGSQPNRARGPTTPRRRRRTWTGSPMRSPPSSTPSRRGPTGTPTAPA